MFNENEDFFFEDTPEAIEEDAILPEDEQEEVDEVGEDTKPPTEEMEPVNEPQKIKVKYNHEEQEITLDEAAILAQKGMNYDKLQEKLNSLQNDPRLSFVEEMARENNMSTDEFLQAVREQREQARLNELVEKNIPEEYAREILENRKFREQYQSKQKEQEQQQQQQAQFQEFVDAFPNVKAEDIPQEVWDKNRQGVPLKYAYMEHEYNQANTKLKMYQQNETNKSKAPVTSVTAHGGDNPTPEDDFLKGFNSI